MSPKTTTEKEAAACLSPSFGSVLRNPGSARTLCWILEQWKAATEDRQPSPTGEPSDVLNQEGLGEKGL